MLLSSSCKKGVPKEVHLVPIKRPFYTQASALVFLSAFSPLPFGSGEPFIEENPFNVFFDVTAAAVTLFFYRSPNHIEVRNDFVSLPPACVSYYSVTAMGYSLTVQSILTEWYDSSCKTKDSHNCRMIPEEPFYLRQVAFSLNAEREYITNQAITFERGFATISGKY